MNKIKLHAIVDDQAIEIFVNAFQPLGLAHFKSENIPKAHSYLEKANGHFYLFSESVFEVWGAINDARGYFVEPYREVKILNDDGTITIHKEKSNPYNFPTLGDDYIFYKKKNL